jgi:menaquinone-dependent protoporphyrinogen oxidase
MQKILLVYASTHGHTAKIAGRLAEAMRAAGAEVELAEAGSAPDPAPFDAAVAAGSLHAGKHQAKLVRWVEANRGGLADLPNAFFSVSLSAAEDDDEAREAVKDCIATFCEDTGWTPDRSVPVAGALQYREYGLPLRLLMRWKMKRGGHPTDISRDYDYTDWDAVDRAGQEFLRAF